MEIVYLIIDVQISKSRGKTVRVCNTQNDNMSVEKRYVAKANRIIYPVSISLTLKSLDYLAFHVKHPVQQFPRIVLPYIKV